MNEQFDTSSVRVLDFANLVALRTRQEYLDLDHIAVALLGSSRAVRSLLKRQGFSPKAIRSILESTLENAPEGQITIGRLPASRNARRLAELARQLSTEFGHEKTSPIHLFLALLAPEFESNPVQATLLGECQKSFDAFRNIVQADPPPTEEQTPDLRGRKVEAGANKLGESLRQIAAELGFRPKDFLSFGQAIADPGSRRRREFVEVMKSFLTQDATL